MSFLSVLTQRRSRTAPSRAAGSNGGSTASRPQRPVDARWVSPTSGAILVALAGAVLVGACSSGSGIMVREPWVRLTDPSRPLAAYMTIANASSQDDALVGAESPAFGKIELHETVPADSSMEPGMGSMAPGSDMGSNMGSDMGSMAPHGTTESPAPGGEAMTMRPVEAIPIPAGGEQALVPGGYHLMLMEPKGEIAVGDVVSLTLRFRSGATVTVDAPVRAP